MRYLAEKSNSPRKQYHKVMPLSSSSQMKTSSSKDKESWQYTSKACLCLRQCCTGRFPLTPRKLKAGGLFWRKQDGPLQVEMFLVSSVAAILAIRAGLYATGYPKLGGGGIHIAHMLWGGLMMFISQLSMMLFLGRRMQRLSAILGGLGFGTFIDELGKFITEDNDYFFRPTPVILYIIFSVLFVSLKVAEPYFEPAKFNEEESLGNVLDLLAIYASTGLTKETKLLIMDLLNNSNLNHPLTSNITSYVHEPESMAPIGSSSHKEQQPYLAFRSFLAKKYATVVRHRYAIYLLNAFFIIQCAVQVFDLCYFLTLTNYSSGLDGQLKSTNVPKEHDQKVLTTPGSWHTSKALLYFREFASGFFLDDESKISAFERHSQIFLMFITVMCVLRGVFLLSRNLSCRAPYIQVEKLVQNRVSAFIWFRRSMVVRLLVTDALLMNHSLTWAFIEIAFTLSVIGALTFMLVQEATGQRERRLSQGSIFELDSVLNKIDAADQS